MFDKKPVLLRDQLFNFNQEPVAEIDRETRRDIISQKLKSTVKKRKAQKRCLSNHITSRWYRPPEIILVEKNYNTGIDMWGLGCILAEMLYCVNVNRAEAKGVQT